MELSTRDTREWQGLVNAHFLSLACEFAKPLDFCASARALQLGEIVAAEVSVDASRVTRLQRDADHDARACFKVLWQLCGESRIVQGTRDSLLRPGHWSVYDTRRSYSIEAVGHARFLVLLVPQQARFGWSAAVEALAGRALPGHYGSRVVMAGLAALLREDTAPDIEGCRLLEDSTVMLLEHALMSQATAHPPQRSEATGRARLAEAQDWIRRRLHDPRLSPGAVAVAMNLSRRSLYNLFLHAGTTPRAFIQHERMVLARQLLADPSRQVQAVGDIATRCGFSDPAHFSRAFSNAQGCSPSVWRAAPH